MRKKVRTKKYQWECCGILKHPTSKNGHSTKLSNAHDDVKQAGARLLHSDGAVSVGSAPSSPIIRFDTLR